jgi:hypothetical protein
MIASASPAQLRRDDSVTTPYGESPIHPSTSGTYPPPEAHPGGAFPSPGQFPGGAFPPPPGPPPAPGYGPPPGYPSSPGYPPTDPNAHAYYAQMLAHQRMINGPAATAMLRNSRATLTSYRRLMPFMIIGIVVISFGSMAYAFFATPSVPGAPSVNFAPAILVLLFFGVLIGWALRRQKRTQKATTDYIDAMIAHQEAFQRGEQPGAYPHHPPAPHPPPAN